VSDISTEKSRKQVVAVEVVHAQNQGSFPTSFARSDETQIARSCTRPEHGFSLYSPRPRWRSSLGHLMYLTHPSRAQIEFPSIAFDGLATHWRRATTCLSARGQFTVQIDFISENSLVRKAAVDAHLCRIPSEAESHVYPHTSARSCSRKFAKAASSKSCWPEAGMLPAFISICVGDTQMFARR
jgi:hypothetical protein